MALIRTYFTDVVHIIMLGIVAPLQWVVLYLGQFKLVELVHDSFESKLDKMTVDVMTVHKRLTDVMTAYKMTMDEKYTSSVV